MLYVTQSSHVSRCSAAKTTVTPVSLAGHISFLKINKWKTAKVFLFPSSSPNKQSQLRVPYSLFWCLVFLRQCSFPISFCTFCDALLFYLRNTMPRTPSVSMLGFFSCLESFILFISFGLKHFFFPFSFFCGKTESSSVAFGKLFILYMGQYPGHDSK